jgi:O-antigen/teichoic acid export membrane protein
MTGKIREYLAKLKGTMTPEGSLTKQSVSGGAWMGLTNVFGRLLQISMVLILANLLSPRDFGIVGIALIILSAVNRFSQLGLNSALIYNQDENVDPYLNTTWMLNIGRGVVLAAILVLSAPLVASFFGEPVVADILPVMAIGPLIYGFRNPGIVYFQKDMDFHKQFIYQMSASVTQFTVGVGYALLEPTLWALVFAYIASDVGRSLVSHLLHSYRPWPSFDIPRAKELFDYGKWITGGNALNFVKNEGDDAFVGWFLAASSLGFYQMAYRFSNAPATEITHVISSVAFPAYSKVQDDVQALQKGFFRVVQLTTFLAFPVGIGIAAVAPTFTEAFLGEEWLPMVLPMQILALYATWRSLAATYGSVWRAVGRPDYLTKFQAIAVVLMAIMIYPLTDAYGIVGTSLVILIVNLVFMMPLETYYTVQCLETSSRRLFREVSYPLVASALMGVSVTLVRQNLLLDWAMLEFVLLVLVGIVTYVLAVVVLETQFRWGLRSEVKDIRNAL